MTNPKRNIEQDCHAFYTRLMTWPDIFPCVYPIYGGDVGKGMMVVIKQDSIIFKSGTYTFGGFRTYVTQEVRLSRTPCHYGGERRWFVCPDCEERRVILYWNINLDNDMPDLKHDKLLCRKCHGLVYASERRDRGRGDLNRSNNLYAKIGGKYGGKPKYMRQKTYDRLRQQAKYYENKVS